MCCGKSKIKYLRIIKIVVNKKLRIKIFPKVLGALSLINSSVNGDSHKNNDKLQVIQNEIEIKTKK
jgi:hypothetical protein